MGTAGAPTIKGATVAYENYYRLKDNVEGLFGTLCHLTMSEKVFEFTSAKPIGFTISGQKNQRLLITPKFICDQLDLASAVNTNATMANVTYPGESDEAVVIMNSATAFWMNAASGAALGAGDIIKPSGFEFDFTRGETADHIADGTAFAAEPTSNDLVNVTLRLDFPRLDPTNFAHFTEWAALSEKKCLIKFVGNQAEGGGTYFYSFFIYMPQLLVDDPDFNLGAVGKQPFSVNFKCYGAATAPTGMAIGDLGFNLTQPFAIYVINQLATDPLA